MAFVTVLIALFQTLIATWIDENLASGYVRLNVGFSLNYNDLFAVVATTQIKVHPYWRPIIVATMSAIVAVAIAVSPA